ncbi:MAG TPA: hypothetical protein VHR66_07750 [Gemmataceae bacterium]|jgi:glucose dehydrogenase|nr:hypothetical protein [Gemmataceae bacterium]
MCRQVAGLILMVAAVAVAAPSPKDKSAEYQKKANEAVWDWADERATLDFSVQRCALKTDIRANDVGRITVAVTNAADKTITFDAQKNTSFVVHGTTLFYADYHRMSSGCTLVALDFGTGKQLWKANLKGLGPIEHTKYFNLVTLEVDDVAIKVLSKESAGRYVEFVDRESGKTLGHKVFPRE